MDCCCDYSLNKKLMASCSFGVFADVSLQFHCIAFAIFFKWDRRVRDHMFLRLPMFGLNHSHVALNYVPDFSHFCRYLIY